MKDSDLVKDVMELVRNVAFGCGIVALLGLVFYEPESIGVTKHAAFVGWTTLAIAFGYIALSVYHFERHHPLLTAPRPVLRLAGVIRFCLIVLISEGALLTVAAHGAWQHAHRSPTTNVIGNTAWASATACTRLNRRAHAP